MENKKTLVLTIVAVATLILLVVGATYAYFNVTGSQISNSSIVNATTGTRGSVTYTGGASSLYLNLTAAQMVKSEKNTTYYSTANNVQAGTTATNHTIGTFSE